MATTTLMWTVLPNGGTSGDYRFSVYVSPRLEGAGPNGRLSDYNLGNWAQTLSAALASGSPFVVELGSLGGPQLATGVAPGYAANLDPALWDSAFPAALTKVSDRAFQDHSKRWIRSYRVGPIEDYIQWLYNQIAANYVDHFPDLKSNGTPVSDLLGLFARAIGPIQSALPRDREPRVPKRYDPVPQRGPATHPDAQTEAELTALAAQLGLSNIPIAEWFRAYRFFRRGNQPVRQPFQSKNDPYDPNQVPDRPPEPEFDFHQALAALGDHPTLLRKLGLIIDLTLPHPAATLVQYGQLHLTSPGFPGIGDLTPWTKYNLTGAGRFRPEARANGDLSNGGLRLDDSSRFRVMQTDPDGNAIKVFDYAVNMQRHKARLLSQRAKNPNAKSSQAPEETSLPALRSGGFSVVRDARDDKSWFHLALQAQHESNPNAAVLYADDVLRGFRVDVNYQGKWHSLCRWHGDIQVAGQTLQVPGPGEGYHKAESATSDPEDTPPNAQKPDLYLHESVFAWRNWSLVAPVPGQTIVPHVAPDKKQSEVVEHRQNEAGAGFNIAANFKAEPLSLVPLRYGESYQFRARSVDLAGNGYAAPPSPAFPTPDPEQVPAGFPVSPLVPYRRYDPVPAPMALLAAKVTWGESMEQVVIRSRADGPAAEPLPPALAAAESAIFQPVNLRWIAAPKTDVGSAEAHRAFDGLFKTPQAAYDILVRESGSFDDLAVSGTQIIDVNGNQIDPSDETIFPNGYTKGNPLPDGMYFVHAEDPVALPYLPDPLAHGVTFMPQDGITPVAHRAFAGTAWPEAEPFKLILSGGPTAIDVSGPHANVFLAPGTMLKVRYASAVVPPAGSPSGPAHGGLELMERWHGMGATGQDATKNHHYQHWMLTPWRSFAFVHAVEKPLTEPVLQKLQIGKLKGDTFVTLFQGAAQVHAPSTGEVELRGRWVDMVDDATATDDEDDPHPVSKDSHVWDRKVDYGESLFSIPEQRQDQGPRHEFGDTKHRFVYYRFIGTTRYREYFPPALTDYETVETHPHDPELTQKKKLITRPGPEFLLGGKPLNVLSSARPAQPDILYILPTFKWVDTANGRRRLGRGLRIYLRRGWFSSGVGELLGVVLMPPGPLPTSSAEELRKYVSQWGNDPIFDADLGVPLTPAQFTHDPAFPDTAPGPVGNGLLLAETETAPVPLFVQVQGFTPLWDAERKLWYVDLELLPTTHYYTFVRLGLCRFQPDSVSGCHISKVVQSEFAQLLADRSATLNRRAGAIDITLAGPSALSKFGQAGATRSAAFANAAEAQPGPVDDITLPPLITPDPNAGRGHRVVAQIESRPLGSNEDLGWGTLQTVVLAPHTSLSTSDIVYWMGTVTWPLRNLPANSEFRLAIREYELYLTDNDVADDGASTVANRTKSRLVYVDVFPLTLGGSLSG